MSKKIKSSSSSNSSSSSSEKKLPYHCREVSDVLAEYKVDEKHGLNARQITEGQDKYGKNEIPPPPGTSIFEMIIEQFSEKLVLMLLGAAVISFVLALFEEDEDERVTAFVEPAVIFVILILNAVVGIVQETNAEKAIEKLKESEARDATVVREGTVQTIHAADLVPGDIIHVAVGDKVPADARVTSFQTPTLSIDESNLTGEAEAVNKQVESVAEVDAVNQRKRDILFSGTLVVRGKATAVVVAIGRETEMGKIAADLEKDDEERTPLQKKLDEFGDQLSFYISIICVVVWLINIGHFTDPDHGSWMRGAIYYFKIAVALAVAAIPEGLPAVVTTCLALGTRKMAQKNAVVRSLPSVETLGCTTVICSDKTGTITTNQMTVKKVLTAQIVNGRLSAKEFNVDGDSYSPIGDIHPVESSSSSSSSSGVSVNALNEPALVELSRISALCNEATLGYKDSAGRGGQFVKTGAPTEAALLVLAEKIGVPDNDVMRGADDEKDLQKRSQVAVKFWSSLYEKEATLEFDRSRKSMSVIVRGTRGDRWLLCKGQCKSVLKRCTHVRSASAKGDDVPFTDGMRAQIHEKEKEFTSQGLRCLALAFVKSPAEGFDLANIDKFAEIESHMTFVGLAAMRDPPRPAVAEAILKCRTAGIRVIMITGDVKDTAESICRQIGLIKEGESAVGKSYTGTEFAAMDKNAQIEAVNSGVAFSEVEPKHKLELVNLLKQQEEIVAMTGDGVNDATALKSAHIGVAMGSGTAVACEASKMVLQDDNFATIVMAVEEGRAIYSNTKQFIRYLISSNIGEVACIFLTAALGIPDALIPVQLLWVNLVTDGLPATALGFNPPDRDIMLRAPRGQGEAIVNGWMFFRYLAIGVYVGAATVMGAIWWFLKASRGPHVTLSQLMNFHDCFAPVKPAEFADIPDCDIFHAHAPSTVALSILVTIEMFNALNGLSENQSLLSVTPLSNVYVLLACGLSFALHFMIIYVPFFAAIFQVTPLNFEEWEMVIYISFPVFIIDEILKFISRRLGAIELHDRKRRIKAELGVDVESVMRTPLKSYPVERRSHMAAVSGDYHASVAAMAMAAQMDPLLTSSSLALSPASHSAHLIEKSADLHASTSLSMDSDADSDVRALDEAESHRKRGNAKRIDAPRTAGSAI